MCYCSNDPCCEAKWQDIKEKKFNLTIRGLVTIKICLTICQGACFFLITFSFPSRIFDKIKLVHLE